MDEAVVYEKGREPARDFRKKGCVIDLFLDTQTCGSLDGWTIVIGVGSTNLSYASERDAE